MLGRHVGKSAASLRLSRGARARNETPSNARARQAEDEEEREGQQRESREAAAKGRRRGSEGAPRTAQDRTHQAGHTQTGGGRSRGGERGSSRAGGEREDQQAEAREPREPPKGDNGAVFAASGTRERSPVSARQGLCQGRTGSKRFPAPLGGLTKDLTKVNCRHRACS